MTVMRATWRAWAIVMAAAGLYTGLGFWWSSSGTMETWIFKGGLAAATVIALAFIITYTVLGLRSDPARITARWWKTAIGMILVLAASSVFFICWPLAVTFWFYRGDLPPGWLAWAEVSGPCLAAIAWLLATWLWLRTWFRAASVSRDKDASPGD